MLLRTLCVTATLTVALSAGMPAQSRDRASRGSGDLSCNEGWNDRRASHCEIRQDTIGGANPLDVDATPNGGIHIRGWDRGDVLVRSKVVAQAGTDADARRIVSGVRIDTSGGRIRAEGPRMGDDESWSVSFDIQVPRMAMLTLTSRNGGIAIDDFRGTAKFQTTNGGVSLHNVGGDLRGSTSNGGVSVDLEGDHWDGAGLDVETRNGGVRVTVPATYSAELETETVNGRINIDFPITTTGRIGRHISTTLGAGGPKIRAVTTNGGVTIRRQ
jgi:putative adhesin